LKSNYLQKQIYTEDELIKIKTRIEQDEMCICEKYNMSNWTDTTYDNLNDIFDNIYEDFRIDGDYEYNVYNLIYNNIYVQIVSDSDYIQSEIIFKYIESQISINDLTLIKNTLFSAFDKNKKFYER